MIPFESKLPRPPSAVSYRLPPNNRRTFSITWGKVLKLVVVIIALAGCGYQTVSILTIFFKYPTIIGVSVETSEKLEMPGITLCSTVG